MKNSINQFLAYSHVLGRDTYLILAIASIFININLFAQTEVGIEESSHFAQEGYYYKDLNNVFDIFEGTYLYSSGATELEIVLQKMEMSSVNNIYYEDMLIGAYRYVENGIELVNTHNGLEESHTNGDFYPISGSGIITGNSLGQDDVAPDEKWLRIYLDDPTNSSSSETFLKKTTVNGQEAIKVIMIGATHANTPANEQTPFAFPLHHEFILTKVE